MFKRIDRLIYYIQLSLNIRIYNIILIIYLKSIIDLALDLYKRCLLYLLT